VLQPCSSAARIRQLRAVCIALSYFSSKPPALRARSGGAGLSG
jgi:hypothetical protein